MTRETGKLQQDTPARRDWRRWLRALRPGFLLLAVVACALGIASARWDGVPLQASLAAVTLVLALLAHAAVNVYNDVADADNGSDAMNVGRIAPFTGGSRVIQDGDLSVVQMQWLAGGLAALALAGGLALVAVRGPGLICIGLAGALLGWSYSHPGIALMGRGLGEPTVIGAWTLVVIGADFVQRGDFAATPLYAGLGLSLLAASILLINQVPDMAADAACGKRTLSVLLGPRVACRVYAGLLALAYLWLLASVMLERLPLAALSACGALPLGLLGWRVFAKHVADGQTRLLPALQASVGHALSYGVLLSAGLLYAA